MHRRDGAPVALVLGFGPFGEVLDNPSSRLARAVDGLDAGPFRLVGRQMPVSYRRSVEETAAAVATHAPEIVLGVGVAVQRTCAQLERTGRAGHSTRLDVDQRQADWISSPRRRRVARLPLKAMQEASGLEVSDDCGSYVCNGWLYACLGMLPLHLRVGFLHIPRHGLAPDVVQHAIAAVPARRTDLHGLR